MSLFKRESTILHFELPSTCLHKESREAVDQVEKENAEKEKRRKSTMKDLKSEDAEALEGDGKKKKRVKYNY